LAVQTPFRYLSITLVEAEFQQELPELKDQFRLLGRLD
jgi:hypothetical protein